MAEKRELLPGISIAPKTMRTARGEVEYDLTPGDGPVVLVCHGGLGGVDQGRVMAAWVDTSRFRVLSLSRPGYLGTPLESGRGLEEQADLFAALLDELGLESVAVLAASAGGPPAYTFAMRHAQRCWGLMAVDCVSGYYDLPETAGPVAQAVFTTDFGQKLLKKLSEMRPDLFIKQLFQAEAYYTKEQTRAHLDYVLNTPAIKEFAMAFINTMNPYRPRKAGTDNDMEIYRKLTHLPLERVGCPTLVFHGTHDADVKFYDGVYAYETIPGAQRFWIEEGCHLGFWISPNGEKARQLAAEFLLARAPG